VRARRPSAVALAARKPADAAQPTVAAGANRTGVNAENGANAASEVLVSPAKPASVDRVPKRSRRANSAFSLASGNHNSNAPSGPSALPAPSAPNGRTVLIAPSGVAPKVQHRQKGAMDAVAGVVGGVTAAPVAKRRHQGRRR